MGWKKYSFSIVVQADSQDGTGGEGGRGPRYLGWRWAEVKASLTTQAVSFAFTGEGEEERAPAAEGSSKRKKRKGKGKNAGPSQRCAPGRRPRFQVGGFDPISDLLLGYLGKIARGQCKLCSTKFASVYRVPSEYVPCMLMHIVQ